MTRSFPYRNEPSALDELMTVEEVANLLKVPKSWIYEHVRTRARPRLPHVKLGKYLRFVEADVRTYLAALARGNGS